MNEFMKPYKSFFESEKYYYNYRRNEKELNDDIIFCSDNPESSSHYGNIQRIFRATNKTLKKVTPELIKYFKDFMLGWSEQKIEEKEVIANLNPNHIVSSAGAWDNIEFINYLYDDTNFFDKYDGIITNDGAVFFEITKDNLVSQTNLKESQNDIKIGDIIKFGKYKNKTATVTGFGTDKNNQPTVITDKGEMSLYHVRIDKLMKEDLHLSDFTKHAGISPFTSVFMKDRQKLKGTGNKSAKIKELRVNRKKGYITFIFESVPTYTKIAKAVSTPSMAINKNVIKYTQMVRIIDFFKWAETKPGYKESEMSFEEVKEILKVASIKIFCNCPSFWWQGDAYVASMFDASIFPTDIEPKYWKRFHNDHNFACKHIDILFTSGMNIYINNMTSMINNYLKKGTK